MADSLTRREFMRRLGVTAVGLSGLAALDAPLAGAAPAERSRVVALRHSRIHLGARRLDPDVAGSVLDRALWRFLDAESPEAAWGSLFGRDDVVGIKVNCLGGPNLSTHPTLVAAVVERLQRAGVKPDNIIIWDRNDRELVRAGFTINRGAGVKCYGTEDEYGAPSRSGAFPEPLSRILTERITCLVNMPILKDHAVAGVSFALKNHYGSFKGPNRYHANKCDPTVADVNALPEVREKQRLIVGDCTRASWNGGPTYLPQGVWENNGVLVATDPVAADYVAWQTIDARRKALGERTLQETGRLPQSILTAARRGLGNADPARIERLERVVG